MAINDVLLGIGYHPTPADVVLGNNLTPAASASVTVLPAVGALTLTGLAPTVLTPQVVRPGVGVLTLSGLVPAIRVPRVVVPPIGALTLTGLVPTVLTPRVARPGVGVLAVTGLSPIVVTPRVVRPSVGVLVVAGFAPTVTVSAATVVLPGVGVLTVTGIAPTVLTPRVARPAVGVLTLAGFAPTVVIASTSSSALARPDVGSLVLTGYEPTVTGDPETPQNGGAFGYIQRTRQPKPQSVWLVTETFAPTVVIAPARRFHAKPKARPAVVAVGVGSLALEGFAPVVVLAAPVIAPAPEHEPDATGEPRHERPTIAGEAPRETSSRERDAYQLLAPALPGQPVLNASPIREEDNASAPAAPVPAWLASPIVVDVGYATLLLDGFAPTVHVTTRTTEPTPWSPDTEDDAAILWAAYDLLVNA